MKKVFIIFMLLAVIVPAQSFKVERIKGTIKIQVGPDENWVDLKAGNVVYANTTLVTGDKSFVQLNNGNVSFLLKENAALTASGIKKLTLNELLLALAMEDLINVPKNKEEVKSSNTAVYGSENNGVKNPPVNEDKFGVLKLRGAEQLAENGYRESAIITAKETFRKYPETQKLSSYRIYFADLLYDTGLNEEAYGEYNSINKLLLSDDQKKEVAEKIEVLKKKLAR